MNFVYRQLAAYNESKAGNDGVQRVAIFLRDGERIIGGLLGNTYWGWLVIEIMWIDESARGQGCGQQMLEMAEAEALRRGCHHAHTDTMSFQALPFYQKNGYEIFGQLDDLPVGHSRYFLKKALK
jgi:GNAT superfamily N-acetyltransferase